MARRVQPLNDACDHNVLFGLMYLRTTEQYRVSATQPGFFSDPAFINHQDAVFARYYFEAWDAYRAGDMAATPRAWQIAFSAADNRRVSGLGNMLRSDEHTSELQSLLRISYAVFCLKNKNTSTPRTLVP